jgi:iron complex outermembrane receptor protein
VIIRDVMFAVSLGTAICADCAIAQSTTPAPTTDNSSESAAHLDDIVVTAQRRAENQQNVPIAIDTLTADQLTQAGVDNVTDLRTAVPTLNINNSNGLLTTSLRGIGSNAVAPGFENPVAVYVDGVYYASSAANFLDLNNVAQIEVLKGPQGTLFGRNATAGLIQVSTRTPDQKPVIEGDVSYGNFDTSVANLYVGGGLADNLAADLALHANHQGDGWGTDLTTGQDVYAVKRDITARTKWVYDPVDGTHLTLIGDYENSSDTLSPFAVLAGTVSGFAPQAGVTPNMGYDVLNNTPNYKTGYASGVSLKWEQSLGDLSLISTTAYRHSSYNVAFDLDGSSENFEDANYDWRDTQLSQELQLGSGANHAFTWVAGAYYFNATAEYEPVNLDFYDLGALISIHNKQSTDSIAGYAQGTYHFVDGTNLTLGGRYTSETRKALDGSESVFVIPLSVALPLQVFPDLKATFDKFTYRASLDHRFSEQVLGYISYNTGFKSGGFNTGSPGTSPYQPETIDATEVGLKLDLFDRRVRLNTAAYYYKYSNIQSQLLNSGVIAIANAAGARIYGLDTDFQILVTDAFRLSGGFGYTNAEYTSYPDALISTALGGTPPVIGSVKGNQLPLAPTFTLNVGGNYTWALPVGALSLGANAYYNQGFYFEADNTIRQPAFVDLQSNLKWTSVDARWWVSLYGKNLLDKQVLAFETTSTNGTHGGEYTAPRTYGVTFGFKVH